MRTSRISFHGGPETQEARQFRGVEGVEVAGLLDHLSKAPSDPFDGLLRTSSKSTTERPHQPRQTVSTVWYAPSKAVPTAPIERTVVSASATLVPSEVATGSSATADGSLTV
jgi:hypothetical protein